MVPVFREFAVTVDLIGEAVASRTVSKTRADPPPRAGMEENNAIGSAALTDVRGQAMRSVALR